MTFQWTPGVKELIEVFHLKSYEFRSYEVAQVFEMGGNDCNVNE